MWHTVIERHAPRDPLRKGEDGMADNTSPPLIIRDPALLGGKPAIAGTRISVQLILEKLRDGWTIADLLDDYPHLTREQIVAALAYAAEAIGTPVAS
jgi:uncharacterized protein (DUF433 family)